MENDADKKGLCPVSGTRGRKVDTATVKCLLDISLNEVGDMPYYFCRDRDCPVVYFAEDGSHTFEIQDVRERVFQKEMENRSVFVCYCFRYTVGDIQEEGATVDNSQIVAAINEGIRAGQCACDWRNPQGDCCLGNVVALIKSRS
ncbi:MAG: hypothetical protein JNJ61_13815 [Anaerolineae bacterium]|nr:hypothetical protein [Anaerolineae bacterium]